jgi:hypothetical protein
VHARARGGLTAKNRINNIAIPARRLLKSKVRAGSARRRLGATFDCTVRSRDGSVRKDWIACFAG